MSQLDQRDRPVWLLGELRRRRELATPAEPDLWDAIYPYAWFVGFGVAFGVYWLGSWLFPRKDWA